MSVQALSWASQLYLRPAYKKLLLLALADQAGGDHQHWCSPNLEGLMEMTSMDRDEVLFGLDELKADGLIIPTGASSYRFNGLAEDMDHYVYRLVEPDSGHFYIGVRSCCNSDRDKTYLGSGTWPKQMAKKRVKLHKDIVAIFGTRNEAEDFEYGLISSSISNPLCKNLHNAKP
jgi:hypothetical protein